MEADIELCIAYNGFCLFFSFHAQRTCFCCTTIRCLWHCIWPVSSLKDALVQFVPSFLSPRWFLFATVGLETVCFLWSVARNRNSKFRLVDYESTCSVSKPRSWDAIVQVMIDRPGFFLVFSAGLIDETTAGIFQSTAKQRIELKSYGLYFHVENFFKNQSCWSLCVFILVHSIWGICLANRNMYTVQSKNNAKSLRRKNRFKTGIWHFKD